MQIKTCKYWIVLLIFSLLISYCKEGSRKRESLKIPEPKFKKEAVSWIINDLDTLQTLDIELAKTKGETRQGLMYRKSMKKNRGMLFFSEKEKIQNFYMKNTYISLDLIFIDKNGIVVDIAKRAKILDESSILSSKPAMYVLEINAGLSDEWGIVEGTKITWMEI